MDKPEGFVALRTLTQGPPDPAAALAEIRAIYFRTTKQTIDNDLAHAIALLKSLPSEEDRERATVYMHGLMDMQREWRPGKATGKATGKPAAKTAGTPGGKAPRAGAGGRHTAGSRHTPAAPGPAGATPAPPAARPRRAKRR